MLELRSEELSATLLNAKSAREELFRTQDGVTRKLMQLQQACQGATRHVDKTMLMGVVNDIMSKYLKVTTS